MSEFLERENITESEISQEMQTSFLDYAMSVIVSRALPDVRDGMKPVHRRILHGMNELGVTPDKPHKKSARIVGDVMGKYHPHGDSAIYHSMVRMAQDFSYRYKLVDGHGNFGSVDGDGAAAMRYTEARLSKLSMEMLRDINKDTVDFQENYDGNEKEPAILPARFPNLLVNGASGIAVGMATNIPPHNLTETINATRYLMRHPEATTLDLMEYLPAPDFPTGGILLGKAGVVKAYETGRGSVTLRAKARIETDQSGRETIIVDEIPYMVNKATMIQKIAQLVRDKEIDGITELRDESDQNGMRVIIGIRRDASAGVILNNLYKMTQMQTSFGINNVAIVDGVPRTLSLKEILAEYIKHQKEVITRRTQFDKKKAEDRAHILEGLRIALDNIDEIINIIRSSRETDTAKVELMKRYELSDKQAQSILDMRLARLTGLEREKIENEYQELRETIADLADVLAKPERVVQIIDDEMTEIAEKYGDDRRTELQVGDALGIEDEDLIEREDITILLTDKGYIKRVHSADFRPQHRGGRGIKAMNTADDDYIPLLLSCSSHDMISFFTNKGKVYRCKAYEIPEFGRQSKGIPIVNILELDEDEKVEAMLPLGDVPEKGEQVFFVTKHGTVKRTPAEDFKNIRTTGLIAINLKDEDELVDVFMTQGNDRVLLASRDGYAVHFQEDQVRSMGRTASGVRGINLRPGDEVIGGIVVEDGADVLVITHNGYGKRTPIEDYPLRNRGGKGVKTANITDKNGPLVGLLAVYGDEEIMVITSDENMIRFAVEDVSQTGRATLGVRLVRMGDGTFVTTADVVSLKESTAMESSESNYQDPSEGPEDFEKDISASSVEEVIDSSISDDDDEDNLDEGY